MTKISIKGKYNKTCIVIDESPVINEVSGYSDNQCEWLSLIEAMKYISGHQDSDDVFFIYTDSVLLYKQIIGKYRIKSKVLKPLYFQWNMLKNILIDMNLVYGYISGVQNIARGYII